MEIFELTEIQEEVNMKSSTNMILALQIKLRHWRPKKGIWYRQTKGCRGDMDSEKNLLMETSEL